MFKLFADLIAFHLDAYERLADSAANLLGERQNAELREQFIAVLGHDLRNPLASIDAGTHLLLRTTLDDKAKSIVGHMRKSVDRMAELIGNVLDLARARLGGGLVLERKADPALVPMLEQMIAEMRAARPDRAIKANFAIGRAVN
jgi:signal transduction histidine kinase